MMKLPRHYLVAAILVWSCADARAQFTTVINAPPTVIGDQQSIGSDTQLNLANGGVVGEYFQAGAADNSSSNVEVNISGGTVGGNFTAHSGSTVNITGGTIGGFNAGVLFGESTNVEVNVSGGNVQSLSANGGSAVNFSGGYHGDIYANYLVNVSGGTITQLHATVTSEVNVTGGMIDRLETLQESVVNISGTASVGYLYSVWGPGKVNITNGTVGLRIGGTIDFSGGVITNRSWVSGASLTISGGMIDYGFGAVNSTVNLSEGMIGDDFLADNSTVNVTSGTIGSDLAFTKESALNVWNGAIGDEVIVNNSVANIYGGTFGREFRMWNGAEVNFYGGTTGSNPAMIAVTTNTTKSVMNILGGSIGSGFDVHRGNQVNVFGTQFVLNDVDITDSLEPGVPLIITERDVSLDALLVDGQIFDFDLYSVNVGNRDYLSPESVLTITLISPGDFDLDGDVDGRDFLAWQRNPGIGELSDWQVNYDGVGLTAASTAIPEPGALALVCGCVLLLGRGFFRAA